MRRFVAFSVIAFALTGCGLFGSPKSPDAARETVRGAIQGAAWSVQVTTAYCARVVAVLDDHGDGRADALYDACGTGWETAKSALVAADIVVDAWDAAAAGKVACLATRALDAFEAELAAIAKVAKLPQNVQVTVDDGVALARFLIKLAPAGGSCPMPEPKPAAPSSPAPAVSL